MNEPAHVGENNQEALIHHSKSSEDAYEWHASANNRLLDQIRALIPKFESKIINLGCGVSKIQNLLFDQGYHDITNVDISTHIINTMRSLDVRDLKWDVVDLLDDNMPYAPNTFDFAFDKGTFDAIITGADDWDVDDEVYTTSGKYFSNISRILKSGGIYMQISLGLPQFRRRYFDKERFNWNVECSQFINDDTTFYLYICRKY